MLGDQKLDSNFKSNTNGSGKSSSSSSSNRSKSKPTDKKKKSESNLAQTKSTLFKCHCCSSPNHTPLNCPLKDKVSRSDWFKETGKKPTAKSNSHAQTKDDDDDSVEPSKSKSNSRSARDSKKKGWCNLMIHHQSSDIDDCDLRDLILLDMGSTIGATVCNPKFIANVQPTNDVLHMTTNAGCKNVDLHKAKFLDWARHTTTPSLSPIFLVFRI